jgi:hypothetical protein
MFTLTCGACWINYYLVVNGVPCHPIDTAIVMMFYAICDLLCQYSLSALVRKTFFIKILNLIHACFNNIPMPLVHSNLINTQQWVDIKEKLMVILPMNLEGIVSDSRVSRSLKAHHLVFKKM